MKRGEIGSAPWVVASNGRLNGTEKLRLVGSLVRTVLKDILERQVTRLPGGGGFLHRVDLDKILVPDSAIALQSLEFAERHYGRPMLYHCIRTYFWAAMLGQGYRLRPDPETLYIGSLFHDLGIAEAHDEASRHCCFTIVGARAAEQFLARQGRSDLAPAVSQAAIMHLNPTISAARFGAETKLVGAAAQMDAIGLRYHRVPADAARAVHALYPRDGHAEMIATTLMGRPHAPSSRPDFLSKLGGADLARKNPLDRPEYRPSARQHGGP